MKLPVEKRIRAGYTAAFILLFIAFTLTFFATKSFVSHSRAVDHTNAVMANLELLASATKDAETGVRGFVITKDPVFLQPYNNEERTIDSLDAVLDTLFNDNEVQKKNVDAVMQLINTKLKLLGEVIRFYKNKSVRADSTPLFAYRDKQLMDSIRTNIRRMQKIESDVFEARKKALTNSFNAIRIIDYTSLLIAFILAIYSVLTYNKENKAKKESDNKASEYSRELEKRVEELRQANEELVNLKRIEKFAATGRIARTIAHEVRNPLTNIGLAAEQLSGEVENNDEVKLLIDMINRNANRINQLITDLLNSTKFAQLAYRKVSLNKLIDETLEFAEDRLELKGITVEKNFTADDCEVMVDDQKIKIAFLNIIVNAVEAMEQDKGILKIKTERKQNKCLVTIADNGVGISKESMARLFEPYFTSKSNGTGLGLTNTQNIILNHKGSIWAQSESGKGTTFFIELNLTES